MLRGAAGGQDAVHVGPSWNRTRGLVVARVRAPSTYQVSGHRTALLATFQVSYGILAWGWASWYGQDLGWYVAATACLFERQRRLFVGVEAKVLGRGGIAAVAAATGVSRATVRSGLGAIEALATDDGGVDAGRSPTARVRRPGGGRKKLAETDPALVPELLALVDPLTRGDPG